MASARPSSTGRTPRHDRAHWCTELLALPGKYLLSAWTLKEGNWSDDNVQDITMIEIVGCDITGYSTSFDKYAYSGCEVYAPSRWRLIEQSGTNGEQQ